MVRSTGFLLQRSSVNFREVFTFSNKTVLQWFPGHMGRGLKVMQQKLKSVDCIIEVHDARIPISGRNEKFRYTLSGLRPHILVLNKEDLTDNVRRNSIVEKLKAKEGFSDVIFTNCKDNRCSGLNSLVPKVAKLIKSSDRYNRSDAEDYCAMVIGVPNVGKSSLINAIRSKYLGKSKAAPVGALAGFTKRVGTKVKVCQDPLIYIMDTPGILQPNVADVDTGFKLALCSTMQDHLIGVIHIADYLLYFLNKRQQFDYARILGVSEPTDSIEELLIKAAVVSGKMIKRKDAQGGYASIPDVDSTASHFLKLFRTGELGKFILDDL